MEKKLMARERILSEYAAKAEQLAGEILLCKRRGRRCVAGQLAAFVLAVACVAFYTTCTGGTVWLALAVAFAASYIGVRRMDVANGDKKEQLEALLRVYRNEMAYMEGDFSPFFDGEKYNNPHHEYSFDLDMFGQQSLFQRIDRTVTTGGGDWLAHDLCRTAPKPRQEIIDQKEAIDELAGKTELRMAFMAKGKAYDDKTDTAEVMRVIESARTIAMPRFATSTVAFAIALLSVMGLFASIVASVIGRVPSSIPLQWALLQLLAMIACCLRSLHKINKTMGTVNRQMKSYVSLMEIISASSFSAKDNVAIVEQLSTSDDNALKSFRNLRKLIDRLDRSGNALYRMAADALFLNDFFIVRSFAQWKMESMSKIDDWIEAVSHFDALVSMATFRYNEPNAKAAEIVESDEVVYKAEGIYHPFLGDKAVPNDFCISDAHFYIVTGANMAGKSTFLRSIGVNYILAMCGMPIFAKRLVVSRFSLFSSMRTTDDLAHGISYFNAELLRLKQLITTCQHNSHTLIILDEILKGTNSADKLNGSRLFLEHIAQLPVTGIIATHDLELSKMEKEHPVRFHNCCFEIELTDNVTYNYKITSGVAHNQNATYLLKELLKRLIVTAIVALTTTFTWADDSLMTAIRRNLNNEPLIRDSYISFGQQFAGKPWTSPSAQLFAEFRTNGNRTRYEQATFAKRRQLAALVMAEVAEGKGRFMGDIVDGLTSTMEETWWGIPAHYGPKVMKEDDQTVDLFNAETAGLMAWTRRALKEQIDSFSPLLTERIDREIERRILVPALNTDYWWKRAGMNWNPWICSNWLACVLFCEHDSLRREKALGQISQALQCFFNSYPDDGGCDEGPTYWDRAAASLFDCLILLEGRGEKVEGRDYCTAQESNASHRAEQTSTLYPLPSTLQKSSKLLLMASYCYSTYIADGYCLSFADSHGNRLVQQPNVMFPFALYVGDKTMQEFAAYVAQQKGFAENAAGIYDTSGNYPTLGRELMFLSCLDKFLDTKPAEPLLADTWLPRLQIFTARRNGVFVGMKGGHNDESHNHNDVGSFVVYDGGKPLLIDPGVGEYTSKTFSKDRYEIWTMQSAYHNLPQINGCDQRAGKQYAARNVERKKGRLTMDIAGAYPDSANVERWTRTVSVSKQGHLTLTDDYRLRQWQAPTRLMFIAAAEPKVEKDGIRIGNRLLHYDTSLLTAAIEPLTPLFDPMMQSMWQGGLWRIVLTVKGKETQGEVRIKIS